VQQRLVSIASEVITASAAGGGSVVTKVTGVTDVMTGKIVDGFGDDVMTD
jgi:hypothetical protein